MPLIGSPQLRPRHVARGVFAGICAGLALLAAAFLAARRPGAWRATEAAA